MGRLDAKVVLVTGAARGLGAAITAQAVAEGATVIAADVAEEVFETAAALGADAIHLDVTRPESWASAAAYVCAAHGGNLDVLVNNAGIVQLRAIADLTVEEFARTLEVNVTGTFLGIKAFTELRVGRVDATPGSIVNLSSSRGLVAGANLSAYIASKFAVRGLTEAAAVELGGGGVRVNAVCPGPIETDMTTGGAMASLDWATYLGQLPLRRRGRPDEVAKAVCWLASDESSYVTGTELVVDGGLTSFAITANPLPH